MSTLSNGIRSARSVPGLDIPVYSGMPNLVAWYDATNAKPIYGTGSKISQWSDLSGNGNHATQETSADQPQLLDGQINGMPGVYFNSTLLESFDQTVLPLGDSGGTIFIVLYFDDYNRTPSAQRSLVFGNEGANIFNGFYLAQHPGSEIYCHMQLNDNNYGLTSTSDIYQSASNILHSWRRNSATSVDYITYSQKKSNAILGSDEFLDQPLESGNLGDANIFQIGQSYNVIRYFIGAIGEMIFFDNPVSDALRDDITQYLKNKWKLNSIT